jgi:hypothetical protein
MSDVREEVTQRTESSAGPASAMMVSSSSSDEMTPECEKGSDAGHCNRFQSKLLMLFCIRAINSGYQFYFGTELFDQGNKFDELIFKFIKGEEAKNVGENWPKPKKLKINWPYQYLQAKSRLNETKDKITAGDLFAVPEKGKKINIDFSLPTYFRSYREITRRGDEIDSCIICTNIEFENKEILEKNGIEIKEVQLTDHILKFEKLSDGNNPTR